MAERVILGVAGYRRSGKDTLAALLAPHGFKRLALADPLKAACREIFSFTAEQVSDPALKEATDPAWGFSPRWAMQRLGTEGVRQAVCDDVWVRALLRRIDAEPGHVVVTDVRFPNEVEAVRSRGGRLFLVERPGVGAQPGDHVSEALPAQRDLFDAVVRNDGQPEAMLRHPAVRDLLAGMDHAHASSPTLAELSAAHDRRAALKDATWLRVAREMSLLGTCQRLRVGCVLLRADGSVAGVGYNGALPGQPHCDPSHCNASARCLRTRHAERSALDYSTGPVTTAYVTDEPCLRCAMDLAARGVRRVVFGRRYQPAPDEAEARAHAAGAAGISWEHRPIV